MGEEWRQPEVNIGTAGHVDHGKTTLVAALTGVWTSRHSEELKRGMTIKLGYADGAIYRCSGCEPPQAYSPFPTCAECPEGSEPLLERRVSYVDAPGHEVLMATMLSGAALMDGALLVVAANEKCPQPQTLEHFVALQIIGTKRLIIVQNKVDIVSPERAKESYAEIKKLVEGTWAEDAPIIPVSALKRANVDALLMAIQEYIPTPERDPSKPPLMYVARSFDVNKPGTPADKLVGGVVGGSVMQGELRVGQEVVLTPGTKVVKPSGRETYEPLRTKITSMRFGDVEVERARPGGLVAIGTELDPSLAKADGLVGNVLTLSGKEPESLTEIEVEYHLLERVVGLREFKRVEPVRPKELLMLTIGTAITLGTVTSVSGDSMEVSLRRPVAHIEGSRVALGRQVLGRWRLIGWGILR
ncbi:MAG: translation initiation factor IF-2 subunit gamma [Fervidicoccaceae archaeon]